MFMGEFERSVDQKGRIIIPAQLRDTLGDSFVMTKGLDKCLFVYPHEEWETLTEKLQELPFTRSDARSFVRFFFSGAADCSSDSQGRTLIPANLRSYADLDREAVVIGVGSRIEIWSSSEWDDFQQDAEQSYEEVAEKLTDLGSIL